jgi:Zn-finger protein
MRPKSELLAWLCGDICPVCQQPKGQYLWTCAECFTQHRDGPEERALSEVCDDHMRKADAFLALPRRPMQKPETD